MKFAIKLGDSFYYDGHRPVGYEGAGFRRPNPESPWKPTVWDTADRPMGIVAHWFDNNGNPKVKDTWHCTIDSHSIGKFDRVFDEATKKVVFPLNEGPFPEVVEVADDFGRDAWTAGLG